MFSPNLMMPFSNWVPLNKFVPLLTKTVYLFYNQVYALARRIRATSWSRVQQGGGAVNSTPKLSATQFSKHIA